MTHSDHGRTCARPVTFGDRSRLFGVLTTPTGPSSSASGVVLCAPLGHEGIGAFRPLRTLAHHLARRGMPVLRFDWPGDGDSDDTSAALAGTYARWTSAVQDACTYIREAAGVEGIVVGGLRVGATLALLALADGVAADELLLLEPFVTGRAYLRDLQVFQAFAASLASEPDDSPAPLPDGVVEASGFGISRAEVELLQAVDLRRVELSAPPRRCLVSSARGGKPVEDLVANLGRSGVDVTYDRSETLPHAWAGANISAMPASVSDAVCRWLGPRPAANRRPPVTDAVAVVADGAVREEGVVVRTPRGDLFGVVAEPLDRASSDWIVFLNAGRVRRIGPNRLWTSFARNWAARGIPSLRLDVSGTGDSDGDLLIDETPGQDDRQSYVAELVDDVRDALQWLSAERGAQEFTLIGLCAGATWSFQVAIDDPRVVSVQMVNPRLLTWDDTYPDRKAVREARRILRNPALWRPALAGSRPGGRALGRGLLSSLRFKGNRATRKWMLEAIDRVQRQGTRIDAIFAAGDAGLEYFEQRLGGEWQAIIACGGGSVEIIKGPDHTFRPLWAHGLLREMLERHLVEQGVLRRADHAVRAVTG